MTVTNYQASLVLNQEVVFQGIFPSRENPGGEHVVPIGAIRTYAFDTALSHQGDAAGGLLPISQNTALFSLLGTYYGGDGKSTFALPDLIGKVMVGQSDGGGPLSYTPLGSTFGASSIDLQQTNLPGTWGGNAEPIDNRQPSLAVTPMISLAANGSGRPAGEIVQFAGSFAAQGYMIAEGQELDKNDYPELYAVIGTTYGGAGDKFFLPDLRGRAIVGAQTQDQVGSWFGSESISLQNQQMPVGSGGGGQSFDNGQPSLAMNYIIAVEGIFLGGDGFAATLGEVVAFAGKVPPDGWVFANGQTMPINQNQALFSLLGTTFGGDGRTTFALPDLRGKLVVGEGGDFTVGETLGTTAGTIQSDDIPGLDINGGGGADQKFGAGRDDRINGYGGNDELRGYGGKDLLNGGADNNTLSGGTGADVFLVGAGNDVITDFSVGEDHLRGIVFDGVKNLDDLRALIDQSNHADTVFTFANGHTLTLQGVDWSTLGLSHIQFAPVITSGNGADTATYLHAESSIASIATVEARDTNSETLAYAIAGGADAGKFQIDPLTGVLSFRNPANYEAPGDANQDNAYEVIVRVTDPSGQTDTQTLTVTVTNSDEAPTLVATATNGTFIEDQAPVDLFSGLTVGTVEAGQLIEQLILAVSGVADGSDEILVIDGTSVSLGFPHSGTTTGSASVGYSVSLNAGIATVTLADSGLSTAQTQALLDAISYQNLSQAPSGANRTVTLTSVTDSGVTTNYGVNTASVSIASTVQISSVNDAPTIATELANQSVAEETPFSFVIPDGSFADVDNTSLTYTAVQADGTPLPTWLTLTGKTFSGTPPLDFNGTIAVKVTASDGTASVSDEFNLVVTPVNDAPTLATELANQSAAEETAFSFVIPDGNFADVDNTSLTYTAVQADGTPLPTWLTLTGKTFTGTPPLDFNGAIVVKVTASDGTASISDEFNVVITPVNDAPTGLPTGTLASGTEDVAYVGDLSTLLEGFSDVDIADQLRVTAITSSHGSVTIDQATGTFTLNPTTDYNGPVILTYTVSDGNGGTISDVTRTLTLDAVDDAPAFAGLDNAAIFVEDNGRIILDANATIGDVDTGSLDGTILTLARRGGASIDDRFDISSGSLIYEDGDVRYVDGDGMQVTFGTVSNPGDGTFSITFNGQATQALVDSVLQNISYGNTSDAPSGSITIDYSFANDQIATGSIVVSLVATNDQPDLEGVTAAISFTPGGAPQAIGSAVSIVDVDTATLASATVSIVGVQVGDLLAADTTGTTITASFSAGVLTLSGSDTLEHYQQVLATVTYQSTATDPTFGGTVFDKTIYWELNDGQSANPTSIQESTRVTFAPSVDADASSTGRDYAASYTENATGAPVVDVDVALSGGSYGLTSASVVLTDAQAGDSLQVGTLPASITASVDTTVTGKITVTLTGSASAADYQQALLAISFSSSSDAPGTSRAIEISTSDGMSTSATAITTIAITEINDVPTVAHIIPDQSVQGGQALNFAFASNAFADADNASLSYTATLGDGSPLPAWLSFDPNSRTFTGTPPVSSVFAVTVEASDGTDSVTDSFTITTSAIPVPPNRAPVSAADIGDQTAGAGEIFTFAIPAGAFTDPDGNSLTYSVSGLPSWLQFDAQTQTFTGTPGTDDVGVVALTVTASDGSLSVSDAFNLIVNNPGNPANEVTLSNANVAENAKKGTVIGTFSGVDSDGEAFVSYALSGGSGPFSVNNGSLVVNKNGALDFETQSSYQIFVTVTDKDGETFEEDFTISLTDVVENPKGDGGKNDLEGDAGDNILDGKGGKDKLTGGDGADTFVFGKGYGKDTIMDFDALEGDTIDLSHAVGIKSFNDLMKHHLVDTGHHIKITAGDGSVLIIKNIEPDDLTSDMFLF